ncbi:MarR family winged helix-turn-helix transcriptional regulator [soil metagenome]
MSTNEFDTIGFLLGEATRIMRNRFDEYAQTKGITRPQWLVLIALMRQEPVNQTTLANYLEVEAMSLCRMADRLQAAGMLERRPDPTDRRVRLLYLSPAARELLGELRRHGAKVMEVATSGFTERQKDEFVESLEKVRANLLSSRADGLLAETLAEAITEA